MSWQAIVGAVALLIVVATIFWFRQHGDDDHAGFTYDQLHRIYLQKDQQAPANAVLLLGDSHTHALCEACLGVPAVNLGIGGDTVGRLIRRVADYRSVHKPTNLVVVEVGANDVIWEGATDLSDDYRRLLQALEGAGHVLVYEIFPLAQSSQQVRHNKQISAINSTLGGICKQMKNCSVVRVTAFYTESGFLREDLHAGDGIHLNEKAYGLWADDLRQRLAACRTGAADVSC